MSAFKVAGKALKSASSFIKNTVKDMKDKFIPAAEKAVKDFGNLVKDTAGDLKNVKLMPSPKLQLAGGIDDYGNDIKLSDVGNNFKNGVNDIKSNFMKATRSGDEGTGKVKPNQVHHFSTNKSKKYTQQFEQITKKYKLDLDDEWNKELMPHQGRHPYAYHDYVLEQMKKFDKIANGDQEKFLKLYEQLKKKVMDNPDMLTKDYWNKQ